MHTHVYLSYQLDVPYFHVFLSKYSTISNERRQCKAMVEVLFKTFRPTIKIEIFILKYINFEYSQYFKNIILNEIVIFCEA